MTDPLDPVDPVDPVDPDDAPWFAGRQLISIFVPFAAMQRPRPGTNGLALLRQVFVSFSLAVVMIGVVVLFLTAGDPPENAPSTGLVLAAVAALGFLGFVAPQVVVAPLDCSSDATLVGGYRTRFFLRLAFAESAALVGFVGALLTGAPWPYLVGAAITAVGFARLAPTDANLAAEQDALATAGCPRDLRHALVSARLGQ